MAVPNAAGDLDPVALEESLISTWREEDTFGQQVNSRKDGKPFIFLKGLPLQMANLVFTTWLLEPTKLISQRLVEGNGGPLVSNARVAGTGPMVCRLKSKLVAIGFDEQRGDRGLWDGGVQRGVPHKTTLRSSA